MWHWYVCISFPISLQRTPVLSITLIVNLLSPSSSFYPPTPPPPTVSHSKGPRPTLEVGGNERKYRASLKFLLLSLICVWKQLWLCERIDNLYVRRLDNEMLGTYVVKQCMWSPKVDNRKLCWIVATLLAFFLDINQIMFRNGTHVLF